MLDEHSMVAPMLICVEILDSREEHTKSAGKGPSVARIVLDCCSCTGLPSGTCWTLRHKSSKVQKGPQQSMKCFGGRPEPFLEHRVTTPAPFLDLVRGSRKMSRDYRKEVLNQRQKVSKQQTVLRVAQTSPGAPLDELRLLLDTGSDLG